MPAAPVFIPAPWQFRHLTIFGRNSLLAFHLPIQHFKFIIIAAYHFYT